MNKKLVVLGVVFGLIVFGAVFQFLPKELLIDSFEGSLNAKTVDFGSSEGSVIKITALAEAVCGQQSMRLDYDLKPSGYMWAARGYGLDVKTANKWLHKPQDINWRRYRSLSLQMYGNNTKGIIALDLKDSGGEMWRFILDDNFSGWKEIVCPFSKFFARTDWQPDNADGNGIMDFPVMSFQFEPRVPGQGSYYFDCVKLVTKTK
jgi:hypothetical protein